MYDLALPNGNPFGYYSYLPDPHYIYHCDAGYEYVLDANDGVGGVYFYDFASGHWRYTAAKYPFPYIYDFGLNAFLYYFPDTQNAGHYTTNPRFFHNFRVGAIVTVPNPPMTFTCYKLHGTATLGTALYDLASGVLPIDGQTISGMMLQSSIAGAECLSANPSPTARRAEPARNDSISLMGSFEFLIDVPKASAIR